MYYRKKTVVPSSRSLKINFTTFSGGINTATDEHMLPQKYAKMAYNFSSESGALKKCFGIDAFADLPENFRALRSFYYRRFDKDAQKYDDKIIVLDSELELYCMDADGDEWLTKIEGVQFQSIPAAINYRLYDEDVIIFSNADDGMIVWNGIGTPAKIEDAPQITSMCVHYERLFATIGGEKTSLWFSADLDPTNWTVSLDGAGFIDMVDERGQLLKVLSFLDYVYVFRNNGIARVTAYGDQTQFNVSQLYTGTGKIYEGSAAICGDRIIFLAEDGVYVFDGISTYRILDSIRGMFAPGGAAAGAYMNGKYYLACRLDFADGGMDSEEKCQNNALIEYNLSSRSFAVMRGADIAHMTVAHNENFSRLIFCLADGRMGSLTDSGGLFGSPLKKSWLTPVSDFGYPDRKKRVKDIFILSREDMTLFVYADGQKYEYKISGGEGVTSKKLGLTGTLIGLEFISDTHDPYICKPMLTAEVI